MSREAAPEPSSWDQNAEEQTMPRRDLTLNFRHVDVASYRSWGRALSDTLVAAGLTRTAALDWATVALPTSSNTAPPTGHMETFEFGGAQQAGFPMRLDLFYGYATDKYQLWLRPRLGNATLISNGTQQVLSVTMDSSGSVTGWETAESVIASDGENWLTVALGHNIAGQTMGNFSIERLRDTAGAYRAGAWVAVGARGVRQFGAVTTHTGNVSCVAPVPGYLQGPTLLGGTVALLPMQLPFPGQPPTALVYAWAPEWTNGEEVTLTDGRQYRALQPDTHVVATAASTTVTTAAGNARSLVRVA